MNFRGEVIEHFVKSGYSVVLVAPEKEDKQLVSSATMDGIKYIPIEMGRSTANPASNFRYFIALFKIIKKEKPDYVFNYTIKPNIFGSIAAKLNGCHTTAMMAGMGYVFEQDNTKTKIARTLYHIGLRFTDHLLLLNESNLKIVRDKRLCSQNKIVLLNGGEGVNLEKFQLQDNDSDDITFLFIGRVLWDKGYDEFTKAAQEVKEACPKAKFKVLGSLDPSHPNSVPIERVRSDEAKGLIEYCGFTNDMNAVYKWKGVVVTLPTTYGEGMNRSLMEACASGKPIITTDIAGCRELVADGGNGYLTKPKDAAALAEAMLKYLKLPEEARRQFSLKSREIAERRFDVNDVIKVYMDIVKD